MYDYFLFLVFLNNGSYKILIWRSYFHV